MEELRNLVHKGRLGRGVHELIELGLLRSGIEFLSRILSQESIVMLAKKGTPAEKKLIDFGKNVLQGSMFVS